MKEDYILYVSIPLHNFQFLCLVNFNSIKLSVKKKVIKKFININIHLLNNNQIEIIEDVLIILSQMQIYSCVAVYQTSIYVCIYSQSIEISHFSVHVQSSRHPSWLNFIHVASNRVN